jgi:membrane protease YdiL (CAAX protease family)
MRLVLLVTAGALAAVSFAFRPELGGTLSFWLGMLLPYLALAGLALWAMWDDGTLFDKLRPRWGDLSIGALSAIVLLLASWGVRTYYAPPGTPRQAWLLRVYLQIGDAEALQRSVLLTTCVIAIPVLEEIVWRGFVLGRLEGVVGARAAPPLSALLYGLSILPSVWLLRDPVAGLNPLLVIGALGCGIVWAYTVVLTKRLPPVIFSHIAFTYFSAAQFRIPGM